MERDRQRRKIHICDFTHCVYKFKWKKKAVPFNIFKPSNNRFGALQILHFSKRLFHFSQDLWECWMVVWFHFLLLLSWFEDFPGFGLNMKKKKITRTHYNFYLPYCDLLHTKKSVLLLLIKLTEVCLIVTQIDIFFPNMFVVVFIFFLSLQTLAVFLCKIVWFPWTF